MIKNNYVLSQEERKNIEKLIRDKYGEIRLIRKDLDDKFRSMYWFYDADSCRRYWFLYRGLACGFLSIFSTFIAGRYHYDKENSIRRAECIKKIEPDLNEYMETVNADLNQKYPVLDTSNFTYSNLKEELYNAYLQCYAGGSKAYPRMVKEGWEDFYIDYSRGALNQYFDQISAMGNNFEHTSVVDCLIYAIPIGVAVACITGAVAFGPVLYREYKIKKLTKDIQENLMVLKEDDRRRNKLAETSKENGLDFKR